MVKEITYDKLKAWATKAHNKILEKEWTEATAKSFLKHHCFNDTALEKIVLCASNVKKRMTLEERGDRAGLRTLKSLADAEPELHQKWTPPPVWNSGLELDQFPEPCMHQLFLGVTKRIMMEVQNWLALRKKYSALVRLVSHKTKEVMDLHLSWCKIQPYQGGKMGGWVSENYVGFARLLPWVYCDIVGLTEDEPFVPPDKPVSKWTAKECREFLRERRVKTDGKVADLRSRVTENKNSPIPAPEGGNVEMLEKTTLSLWMMLCHLMGMKNTTELGVSHAEQTIRLFLTSCAYFDKEMIGALKRTKPFWVTSYNFTCLLNIPAQIRKFGPIRNRWEGKWRGEGFLLVTKPEILAKRLNWERNLMLKLLRQKCMLHLRTFDEGKSNRTEMVLFWCCCESLSTLNRN